MAIYDVSTSEKKAAPSLVAGSRKTNIYRCNSFAEYEALPAAEKAKYDYVATPESNVEKWLEITDYLTFTSSYTISGSAPKMWLSNKGNIMYNCEGSVTVTASTYARFEIFNISTAQAGELYSAVKAFAPELIESLVESYSAHAERTSYSGNTTNGEMVTSFFDVTDASVSSNTLSISGMILARMHTLIGTGNNTITCGTTLTTHLSPS